MASHEMVLSSVESSNLAPREKSALRRWYDEVSNNGGIQRAKHHVTASAEAMRGGSEAAAVGAVAGLLDSELKNGLDYDAGNNISVPMDGVAGVAALVASAAMGPGDFGATDLRNAGITLVGIASFRRVKAFADLKRSQGKGLVQTVSNVAGEVGIGRPRGRTRIAGEMGSKKAASDNDTIIQMAKNL